MGNLPRGHCIYPSKSIDFEEHRIAAEKYSTAIKIHGWNAKLPTNAELRRHVTYCRRKLEYWENNKCGSNIISKEEILCSSLDLGPDFSKLLKKMNDYCLIDMLNVDRLKTDIPEEYLVKDYDHVDCLPDPKVLIHWTEESDDIKWMFYPLQNEFPKQEFKDMFRKYIEFLKIDYSSFDTQVIQQINATFRVSSKVFLANRKNTVYHGEIPDNYFQPLPGYSGKYCLIQGSPGTTRAVVIPDPSTKTKVDVIEHLFGVLLKNDKSALLGCDGREKTNRIQRLLSKKLFFHLDLKKEGLTIPRQLIQTALEVIQEVSDIDLHDYLDFNDLTIDYEGEFCTTERGRTLGWSNNACTAVLSCILHDFTTRIMMKDHNPVAAGRKGVDPFTSGLSYTVSTDDIIIGSSFKRNAKSTSKYASMLNLVVGARFSYFDLILSQKKLFVSKFAKVLGEVYTNDTSHVGVEENIWGDAVPIRHHPQTLTKMPMWFLIARAYHAWSHFEAKTLFSAAYTTIAGSYEFKDFSHEVRAIYDYWGPEFKERNLDFCEVTLPYSCGGWIIPREENLDASLNAPEHLPFFVEMKKLGGIDEMVEFGLHKAKQPITPESLHDYKEKREQKWYHRVTRLDLPEDYEDDIAESNIMSAIAAFDLTDDTDIVDRLEPRLSMLAISLISGTSERDVFTLIEQDGSYQCHLTGIT
jgi:hypothetical protein